MQQHDPKRQVEYLKECLRQDKAPIGFFLSAGCPVSIQVAGETGTKPLIPDIAGMTEEVCTQIRESELSEALNKLEATFPNGDWNIEHLLTKVRAIASVVGDGDVHGLTGDNLSALEGAITTRIADLASAELPAGSTPYSSLAAWAGAITRTNPIEVFTTNYDLLIEESLERMSVPYFDGFVGSRNPFFDVSAVEEDDLPSRWARVWKLHGSINWHQGDSAQIVRSPRQPVDSMALIHPSHLKYDQSRRMPYLALIDRLRSFMKRRGACLIVSGYSFGDEHLNELIRDGLAANPTAAAFGLMFGKLANYEDAIALAEVRPNLSLLAADEAIIGTLRRPWATTGAPGEKGEGAPIPDFPLGDFTKLGELLGEMVGSLPNEEPHAKS